MKILVVDDSIVFRSQIQAALNLREGLEVVGTAPNGKIALQKVQQLNPDIMTLDMEMPEMDGIETLKELKKIGSKVKVIVFSSQTQRGAEKALEALRLGASDVIAKPSGAELTMENAAQSIRDVLIPKVEQFKVEKPIEPTAKPTEEFTGKSILTQPLPPKKYMATELLTLQPQILVIGSSTGGPAALEVLFSKLKGPYKIPVLIVQHMPPVFTESLAKRLGDITGVQSAEAKKFEKLDNRIYVAPGNYHMSLFQQDNSTFIDLDQNAFINSVRPAVDPLFQTAAKIYGKKVMSVILTGMGEDGRIGCEAVKDAGGGVMIQNKETCIVFGMPKAVFDCGAYDRIGDLDQIAQIIKRMLIK